MLEYDREHRCAALDDGILLLFDSDLVFRVGKTVLTINVNEISEYKVQNAAWKITSSPKLLLFLVPSLQVNDLLESRDTQVVCQVCGCDIDFRSESCILCGSKVVSSSVLTLPIQSPSNAKKQEGYITCQACTLENSIHSTYCELCESPLFDSNPTPSRDANVTASMVREWLDQYSRQVEYGHYLIKFSFRSGGLQQYVDKFSQLMMHRDHHGNELNARTMLPSTALGVGSIILVLIIA